MIVVAKVASWEPMLLESPKRLSQMRRTAAAHLDLTIKLFGIFDVADVVSVVISPKLVQFDNMRP